MKRTICLLVLLAFVPAAHADKKKKQQGGGQLPALGGGGPHKASGGGGLHMPGMSRGGGGAPSHTAVQPRRASPSQPSGVGHSGMSANNPLSHHSSSNSLNSPGAKTQTATSSNPLMRRGGQPHPTAPNALTNKGQPGAKGSNPLTRSNSASAKKGANPLTQKGNQANRLSVNGKNGDQRRMTERNMDAMQGRNTRNQNWNGHNARAMQGHVDGRTWAHAAHANYHVRPYHEVFHGYRRAYHDHYWYRAHYDRVVLIGGGYYYWDAGYWYPAWGYDPVYAGYVYDGPIYSYDNLPPDEVIVNVQTALQDEGYYTGEVDGQLGPQTRDAIAAYQSDHNLEVTSAVDEPTVESLGLADTNDTGST